MKHRPLVIAAAVLVAALGVAWVVRSGVLFRHGGAKDHARSVVVALESELQSLDPANLRDPVTSRVVWQIFEGLVGLDDSGKPVPMLAESWEPSTDFRVWTFRIRPGVQYHPDTSFGDSQQSRTVCAEDVRYSYHRHAKLFGSFVFGSVIEGFSAYVDGKASEIAGIDVPGPLEVRFRLEHPEPSFVYRITSPYLGIMPKEAVESHSEAWGHTIAVGTGPFVLKRAEPTHVVLEKFKGYWRPTTGNVDRIEFRIEKNSELLLRRLERGDYHIGLLPGTRIDQYVADGRLREPYTGTLRLDVFATYNSHYLVFDVQRVPDADLRRKVGDAIDKRAIVAGLLRGTARVMDGVVPPGMLGYEAPQSSTAGWDRAIGDSTFLAGRRTEHSHSW